MKPQSSSRFPSERERLPPPQQATYDAIVARRGRVPVPFLALLGSPAVAETFEAFSSSLWQGRLTNDIREAIFLLTAQLQACDHQWRTHEAKALEAGVPAAVVEDLRAGRLPSTKDAGSGLGAALRFARCLHESKSVPDEVFAEISQHLDAQGISELAAFCALATSIAMLLNVQLRDPAAHVDAQLRRAEHPRSKVGAVRPGR